MANTKQKLTAATIAVMLTLPSLAFADEMKPMTDATGQQVKTSTSVNSESLNLRGKVDGNYKTVFSWNKLDLSNSGDIVEKYLLLLSYDTPDLTYPNDTKTQLFTLDSNLDTTENWKSKTGYNYYRLVAVTQNGKVIYSNTVKLVQDGNGKATYDANFITKHPDVNKVEKKAEIDKVREEYKAKMEAVKKDSATVVNNIKSEVKTLKESATSSLTDDQKKQLEELKKGLEDKLTALRTNVNKDSFDIIKANMEALKADTLSKVSAISTSEDIKKMFSDRFDIFVQNQLVTKPAVAQIKTEMKDAVSTLRSTYFEKYKKSLGDKLDKMSQENLQKLSDRITKTKNNLVNSKASEKVKARLTAQYEALLDVIEEKLTPTDDINIDTLTNIN